MKTFEKLLKEMFKRNGFKPLEEQLARQWITEVEEAAKDNPEVKESMEYGLLENLKRGRAEIVGMKDAGDPYFQLTEIGAKHAENLMKSHGIEL